ncbi:hypothetical protein AOLI_G00097720 [Acnodon oligacanthus]
MSDPKVKLVPDGAQRRLPGPCTGRRGLCYGPSFFHSQPWPTKFEIPTFSFDVELLLEAGNKAYQKDGTLLNDPKRIKYKMGNYQTKLRGHQLACPELEVNSLKRKNNDEPHFKGIKRPKKAEVNYLPPFPFGKTEETLEKERVDLLHEIKKRDSDKFVGEKMEKTFSYQRLEVIKHCPAVPDVIKRWPALFSESQVKDEFRRITTVNLERTFLTKLDSYAPKLLTIFKMKGRLKV